MVIILGQESGENFKHQIVPFKNPFLIMGGLIAAVLKSKDVSFYIREVRKICQAQNFCPSRQKECKRVGNRQKEDKSF